MATSSLPPNAIAFPAAAPDAAPDAAPSGWATKQDWDRHRALIGQLYEKETLTKVMGFMAEQHGFRATFVSQIMTLNCILTKF